MVETYISAQCRHSCQSQSRALLRDDDEQDDGFLLTARHRLRQARADSVVTPQQETQT